MECPRCHKQLVRRPKESAKQFAKRRYCNQECHRGPSTPLSLEARKRIYRSRFSGGDLDAGQYLAENLMDRNARNNGIHLPDRFWALQQWQKLYKLQLMAAYTLLKHYSIEAIIAALRTPTGKRVLSLSAPWFEPVVQNEQEKVKRAALQAAAQTPVVREVDTIVEAPRVPFVPNKSTVAKLKGL